MLFNKQFIKVFKYCVPASQPVIEAIRDIKKEGDSRAAWCGPARNRQCRVKDMRDLLFKNLTSEDRRKKVLASSEIIDKQGVRTTVRRHFVYLVREVKDEQVQKQPPYLSVLKERNTKQKVEKFFCRMKGNVLAVCNGRLYHVYFMHSLKITLEAIPEGLMKYT